MPTPSLRLCNEVGQEGQGEVLRKVTSYGVSWLCFWGGKSRGSMKFGTQSPGPSGCRAGPVVVTIPGSGIWEPEADHPNRKPGVGAGRRWGEWGRWALPASTTQDVVRGGSRAGWGWGGAALCGPQASPSPFQAYAGLASLSQLRPLVQG